MCDKCSVKSELPSYIVHSVVFSTVYVCVCACLCAGKCLEATIKVGEMVPNKQAILQEIEFRAAQGMLPPDTAPLANEEYNYNMDGVPQHSHYNHQHEKISGVGVFGNDGSSPVRPTRHTPQPPQSYRMSPSTNSPESDLSPVDAENSSVGRHTAGADLSMLMAEHTMREHMLDTPTTHTSSMQLPTGVTGFDPAPLGLGAGGLGCE